MNPLRTMKRQAARELLKYARSLPQVSPTDAFKPGTVTHAIMAHDPGCKALHTHVSFDCTCQPDLTFHRASE
jgi:hypothetical protein